MARITLADWTCTINECVDPLDGDGLDSDFSHYAAKVPYGWIVAQKAMGKMFPRMSPRMTERAEILKGDVSLSHCATLHDHRIPNPPGTRKLLDGNNLRSLRAKGIRTIVDVGLWKASDSATGYTFVPRKQTFEGKWSTPAKESWNKAVQLLSRTHLTWLFNGSDDLLLQRAARRNIAENTLRRLANTIPLAPSPTAMGRQIWATDGSMTPASAGLMQPKSVTAAITGPTTLVLRIEGRNIASTQGELTALVAGILFTDATTSSPRLYTDYLNAVNMIEDSRSSVNQDSKLRRMNARSYYRWILSLAKEKDVEVLHTKGHTDELSLPSQMNYEADHYASTSQRHLDPIPFAPVPTFFMDDYNFYSDRDGWIESNIRQLVDMVLAQNTSEALAVGNHQRMLTSVYETRPPPEFPYIRAYSAFSATVQLYARSGQLATADTLAKRNKIESEQCRFGCDAAEDMHHLFVDCKRYSDWRVKAAEELTKKTEKKLNEKGVEEAAQKRLLSAAKSLFSRNDDIWPLKHSFYYLGHIPPLDSLLPANTPLNGLARERLLHHFASDWHLVAIRLAGRIFGDYQREMAKQNTPLKMRGRR
ncbi:hypothetical protein DFH07DRAFT_800602 [Mycena maculata]|uniref:Uncharacterized protein n=1 Tax=Mycena maculata TaxID=230809 RepID=A0AAD7K0A1_9AGAR|nr:hypothetical protein DFH07DRAFT_800602 [Mycena maculata]